MKAAAFIRYHSGDGAGHLGWAFDWGGGCAGAGSVENHSGGIHSDAAHMGFWNERTADPVTPMRERGYDDLKTIEVEDPDPERAHRVVLWIARHGFSAVHRNCLDDTYDVLRAFGVRHLQPPSHDWFPKEWFKRLAGECAPVAGYVWHSDGATAAEPDSSETPWRPTWRRPWHPHFHLLNVQRVLHRP